MATVCASKKSVYQMVEQAEQHGQILLERRGAEVLVHLVEAGEHGAEVVGADGEHGGEADGRIHRVAAADPVPEAEHVGGVDAELRDLFGVGRDGDEVLGDGLLVAELCQRPVARGVGVGHGLERGEGLGGDDEERLLGVEVLDGFGEVGAVDVGDEAEGQVALAVVLQRLVGHDRAEVGAADADVDDVADALAGVALPLAAADAVGEGGHLVEHRVHRGDDVFAVDDDRLALGSAQGDVQDGAVLGDVDLVAAEHRVDLLAQAGLLGQLRAAASASRR